MEINFTSHHLEVTPTLKAFTIEKFGKLERHSDKVQSIHITLDTENVNQIAEATVHIAKSEQLHAHAESENIRSAIELLVNKLDRQLIKLKEKREDRRR